MYYIQPAILLRFALTQIHISGIYEANLWSSSLILNGFAETEKRFSVRKMRLHLLRCLEEEGLTWFLKSYKHTKLSKGYIIYVDIYYICMSPFYEEDSERDKKKILWQNALNVVNGTTKCLKIFSPVFTNKSVEWKCMRC